MYNARLARRFLSQTTAGFICVAVLAACGSGVISYRNVDSSAGAIQTLGTAKHKTFTMTADTEKAILRLTLFEQAECDVIKVKLVDRVRQTLKGDEVVHSDPPARIQMVQGINGTTPCDHTYARDVQVSLQVGDGVYRLGRTSPRGELNVDLSKALRPGMYPNDSQLASAEVLVDWQSGGELGRSSAGKLSLSELAKREARVLDLVKQLEELLGSKALNEPTNLMQAYRLYAELHQLDTGDARIAAVQARFLELFFERKASERADRAERNLKALQSAKDLLKNATFSVPPFVHASLYDPNPATIAIQWALGESITAVRDTPALCGNEFRWQQLDAASPQARFALTYLRFAFGDGFADDVTAMCERSQRF
ncbi:MAG TPA: hypothetical protein VL137_00865 [Polyangiaceae bacterium]|jgi:hypothetical protein|nr:hypothetical protein [Polyangiaceae bacterium]